MKMRSFLSIVCILFFFLGCMNHHNEKLERPFTSSTAILRTTLKPLDLKDPFSDLNQNIKNQDYRFIGVCGIICYAPGIQGQNEELIKRYGVRILDGTSDAIESHEHRKLIESGRKYATKYNEGLLEMINSGNIP